VTVLGEGEGDREERNGPFMPYSNSNTLSFQKTDLEQLVAGTESTQPRQIGDAHPVLISSPGMLLLSCHVQTGSLGHAGTPHAASCQGQWLCAAWTAAPECPVSKWLPPFPSRPFYSTSTHFSPYFSNQLLFRASGPCSGNAISPSPSVLLILIIAKLIPT